MAVRIDSRPYGTGRELVLIGDDVDEVSNTAKTLVASIDFMRSPGITQHPMAQADGKVVARITYYGLD